MITDGQIDEGKDGWMDGWMDAKNDGGKEKDERRERTTESKMDSFCSSSSYHIFSFVRTFARSLYLETLVQTVLLRDLSHKQFFQQDTV